MSIREPDDIECGQQDERPRRTWSRLTITLIAAGAVAVAAIGVTTALLLAGGPSITARGSLEVDDFQGSCATDYPDLAAGTQVVVTDSSGNVIATTALGGNAASAQQASLQLGLSSCIYPFTVKVPGGEARYGITISHRGTIWFTPAEMTKGPGLSINSGGSGF